MSILSKRVRLFLKRISIVSILCVSSASLAACYFLPSEEAVLAPPLIETPKITYETYEVKKGNIEKKIAVSGSFISAHQENVFFKFKGGILKSINTKLGDYVKKGDLLAELDTDSLLSQIKQQEITLRISELRYETKKSNPDASSFELEEAFLNVKSAKIKLEDLQNEYNKAKLYSTISGYVVYLDAINSGDYVSANRTIVTVADPTKLYLQHKGDTSAEFSQGVQVDVKYKNTAFRGEVVSNPATLPIDANKNLRNVAFFKINDLPKETQIGESADITLILEKKEDVIVVPRSLVNSFGGRNYVQVLENGIKYERDVELGLQTATEVEIKKGLKEGDKIIQR